MVTGHELQALAATTGGRSMDNRQSPLPPVFRREARPAFKLQNRVSRGWAREELPPLRRLPPSAGGVWWKATKPSPSASTPSSNRSATSTAAWWRRSEGVRRCNPTSLQQRLVKTGGRLVKHARYYWLLLAESHLTKRLLGAMLRRIEARPVPSG